MNGLNRYIRNVSSCLHCAKSEQNYYEGHIRACLGQDADSLCYEEIVHRLGTPEEWVISQAENLDTGKIILKSIHAYKKVRRFAIIISALFLAFLIGIAWFHSWDLRNRVKTIYTSDPQVISTSIDPDNPVFIPEQSSKEVQP